MLGEARSPVGPSVIFSPWFVEFLSAMAGSAGGEDHPVRGVLQATIAHEPIVAGRIEFDSVPPVFGRMLADAAFKACA